MASHRGHEIFNLLLLLPSAWVVPPEQRLLFSAGYLISTFLMSPDVDLSFSKPSRRLGVFRYIWFPFWLFSRHRGITHVPFLGSLIKLFYLTLLFFFMYFVLLGLFSVLGYGEGISFLLRYNPFELIEESASREELFYFVAGFVLADLYHVILDLITSALKRIKRAGARRRAF